jgi:hypothetical protein
MEKLIEAGLFGGELIELSGSIARRYNQCLAILGVAPTSLERFTIDGMGWSPEIAQEKDNDFYLNLGEANSNAIIISPEQKGKSVNMPFHSFDVDIMNAVFSAYEKPIRDITKDSAVCIQLDQNIDAYHEPFDLLRYDRISLRFKLVNDLDKKQKEQLELIKLFEKDNNFIDKQIHQQLIDFSKKYGDLRHRKLSLDPIQLDVSSFYTKAFGGVFVLKDFVKDIIVFESDKIFKKAINDTVHDVMLYHIGHEELIKTLNDHFIIERNIREMSRSPRYKRIKNHIFIEHLKQIEHPVNEILDNPFLFKKYLNLLEPETIKKVMSIELFNQRKIVERDLKLDDVVGPQYLKSINSPHSSLEKEHRELIWTLLIKTAPKDPLHLYWYDKETFYKVFKTWKPGYQDWVIDCILENNKKYSS